MPAIIAHHLFGMRAYRELARTIGTGESDRDAFLLGNIGPDPLFCLKVLPRQVPYRDIGAAMHASDPAPLFAAFQEHFISRGGVYKAYALGFLCHYLLDSTVHPLVYAQQYALRDEGVEGLPTDHGAREAHAIIETEFDEHLLATRLGVTVREFAPRRETLRCPLPALASLSAALPAVVSESFGLGLTQTALMNAVLAYRAAQVVIDSKRDGLRRSFDYACLVPDHHLHINAFTHAAELRDECVFTNDDHVPWPHPFEPGAVVSESFDELFDRAHERALDLVPLLGRASTQLDFDELFDHVNFRGQKLR